MKKARGGDDEVRGAGREGASEGVGCVSSSWQGTGRGGRGG